MSDARAILLWSAGFSVVALLVAGFYFTDQLYAPILQPLDDSLSSVLRTHLYQLQQSGGGSARQVGVLYSGESIRSVVLLPHRLDYRADELDSRPAMGPDDIRFDCQDPMLACDAQSVQFSDLDSDLRLDVDTTCNPQGKALQCTIRLSPSSSDRFVPSQLPGSNRPILQETNAWFEAESEELNKRVASRTPVLDVYSGRAAETVVDATLLFARAAALFNSAQIAENERLDIAANRKYGIPFVDGTADFDSHVFRMRSAIRPPEPQVPFVPPSLEVILHESRIEEFDDPIGGTGFSGGVISLFGLDDSESTRATAALLYVPLMLPFAHLNAEMNSLAGLADDGASLAAVVYPHLSEGTTEEQAQRLRFLNLLQNRGGTLTEKEQELANHVRWMELHPSLATLVYRFELRKGESVSASRVSAKSGGLPVRFQMDPRSSELFEYAIRFSDLEARAEKDTNSYWHVRKDALNNGYTVIVSRSSFVEEDAS